MNKKVAVLWCQALKSGKFKKNSGTLCSFDGSKLSAFGVLCEISGCGFFEQNHINKIWFFRPFIRCESIMKPNGGETVFVPKCVMDWAEMKTNCGEIWLGLDDKTNMLRLNRDYDFPQMAEFIRNNYQWI